MTRREKITFYGGLTILGLWFGPLTWFAMLWLAWYVRRWPDKKLPLTDRLVGNQKKAYDFTADSLKECVKLSVMAFFAPAAIGIVLGATASLVLWLAHVPPIEFFAQFIPHIEPWPATKLGYAILHILVYPATFIGCYLWKRWHWDPMYTYADSAARALVGSEQYDKLSAEEQKKVKRNVVDSKIGINKATVLVQKGEVVTLTPAAGDLQRWGGTGILIVQEGHAVVLEQSGKISRVVARGITYLQQFERVSMVVSLYTRTETCVVKNVVTRDHIIINSIELFVFHKLNSGNKSRENGLFPFDEKLILERVWSAKGNDWREGVQSIAATALRDVIARHDFEQVVRTGDEARRQLKFELVEAIAKVTLPFLGVDCKAVDFGAMDIPFKAEQELLNRGLGEVIREKNAIAAESEHDVTVTRADAERIATIAKANGAKVATIEEAEGARQAAMLKAEADKQAKVTMAEGEKQAKIVISDGERQATITLSDGERQRILALAEAEKQKRILAGQAEGAYKISEAEGERFAIMARAEGEKMARISKAEAERDARMIEAEGERQKIIVVSEAEKVRLINLAEGEKQKKIAIGEGQAQAITSEEYARAKGAAERIRQMMAALYQRDVTTDKALEMLGSVLKEAELRRAHAMMLLEQGILKGEEYSDEQKADKTIGVEHKPPSEPPPMKPETGETPT